MNLEEGNNYVLTATDSGVPTFIHLGTGEVLHGQVGPFAEAWNLYVSSSGLVNAAGNAVVYDLGMGCGTLPLAVYKAWELNSALKHVQVVSFDLEKNGIIELLRHIVLFEYAQPYKHILESIVAKDEVFVSVNDSKSFTWKFIPGDFTTHAPTLVATYPQANYIFLDFFSQRSHPYLWVFQIISDLFKASAPDAKLVTYSTSTAIKANLLAAGFYVGKGEISGQKTPTTIAAKELSKLDSPLPKQWLTTFTKSHLAYVACETPEIQAIIREKVLRHPQFAEV